MTWSANRRYFLGFLLLWLVGSSFGHTTRGIQFIENKGQWHNDVLFKTSIPGGDLYLLKNKLKYVFYKSTRQGHEALHSQPATRQNVAPAQDNLIHAIELSFVGANENSVSQGELQIASNINYIKGKDPGNWVSGARSFGKLVIDELYPGIDFVLYASNGGLKYDFLVAPGIDPGQIRMRYLGQNDLQIQHGQLMVGSIHGQFLENVPVSYSELENGRSRVPTRFHLEEDVVSFDFPEGYDKDNKLTIDPELIFSTYSGSSADNWGFTATYDNDGNLYSGGIVSSSGFPVTTGVFQPIHAGDSLTWDVGILKYDPTGKNLIWATYLGGSYSDTPQSIIVNGKGQLVIYGTTSSPDFPMVSGSFQDEFLGGDPIIDDVQPYRLVGGLPMLNGTDIYVAILSKNGDELIGSTFMGGTDNDGIMEKYFPLTKNYGDQFRGEVIVDKNDNIYIASNTSSPDFLIKNAVDTAYGGDVNDGVVMKFNPDLTDLYWSTFIGGNGMDALFSVKVDSEGNVFAAGGSNSTDFVTSDSAVKKTKPVPTDIDGIVVKIDPAGTQLLASTYVGTPSYDQAYILEIDSADNIYLLGQTQGAYPITSNVYSNPGSGQFIHKLTNNLDSTAFSTVIGSGSGSPNFSPTAFLVNECGNIFLSGWGGVLNHPSFGYIGGTTNGLPVTENAFQSTTDGTDFYLMVLLREAEELLYATYFGEQNGRGEHVDGGTSRFDKRGIVYQSVCGGCGGSSGFPTWPPDVWSTTNNSRNCNNAAFKFDLASLLAQFNTDVPEFNNPGIREGCYPLELVFLNESLGGENFFWEFGEGTISNKEDSIYITYEDPGTYEVVLTAFDINTCIRESKARGEIEVFDYEFGIMPDDSICSGDEITLQAYGGNNYDWNPKNSLRNANTATPVAFPDTTTLYTVQMIDENGCSELDSLTIGVIPGIITDFTIEKIYDCNSTPVYKLTNLSENASSYEWDFGDGNTSDEFEPVYQYAPSDSAKRYKLTLTSKESFCSNSKTEDVTTVTPFVPNFVSPNNDGKNDAFEITADGGVELNIYNRWGKSVYQSDDYKNNWVAQDLPSGVYFYEIIFSDNMTRCNGWLQVMR